ncbi:aminoacyl-tRNA hydrolase [Candidatus Uhrbacteria bacterium]|nr:aminoacyl-tRNA hydrolase [Candidatus Uhrbacteria bacterium]
MHVIVGLGNPGKEYAFTRHNVGWLALDKISHDRWKLDKRANAETLKVSVGDTPVLLVKPQTFMNNSGVAAQSIINTYRRQTTIDKLVVIHDDIDLALGTIRVSHGSSSGGHKGVRSIINHLDTRNFWRVRIGIRSMQISDIRYQISDRIDTPDFVLNKFSKEEQRFLPNILENVVTIVEEMLTKKPSVKTVHVR